MLKKTLHFLACTLLIVILFLLILLAVFTSPRIWLFDYSSPYPILYRSLLAFVAIFIGLAYIKLSKIRPLQASSIHSQPIPLSRSRAIDLQRTVGRTRPVTSLEAQIFALAITNPSLFRPRINEVYEPSRRTVDQEVTIDIQLPPILFNAAANPVANSETVGSTSSKPASTQAASQLKHVSEVLEVPETLIIPFPVVVPIKGELNDDLEISGINGERLAAYSYSEYLELVAGVLRMLLLKACDMTEGSLHKSISRAEISALRSIMQRGLQSPNAVEQAVTAILELKTVNIANEDQKLRHPDEKIINLIAEVVRLLTNRYAIVAFIECNSDYRSLIRYRRTIVPGLSLSKFHGHYIQWFKERLSILLGARPVSLRIPLTSAATCLSYHLIARCPDGLYLRHQDFPGLANYIKADAERRKALQLARKPTNIPPYYHIRSRLGQPYAHFYSRYFAEPAARMAITDGTIKAQRRSASQMTSTSENIVGIPNSKLHLCRGSAWFPISQHSYCRQRVCTYMDRRLYSL